MPFPPETAKQVEAIFRRHLERDYSGILTFDQIDVAPAFDQNDNETFHVTMVCHEEDFDLLDPRKANAMTAAMRSEFEALGIRTIVLESYVSKEEWDMRHILWAEDPWEGLDDPADCERLEDC